MSSIGIDLGTTNSRVASCRNDKVDIIVNSFAGRCTPSCVVFAETERFIGMPAIYQRTKYVDNSVVDVKRILGRDFGDGKLQRDAKYWPFALANDGNKVIIKANYEHETNNLSPEEIVAILLKNLTETAESHLGDDIKKVVIAVPASFNDRQRRATLNAARIAGLDDVRFINEATAAALAYAFNTRPTERNILVFDLGGGTFDVSVIKLEDGRKVSVLASRGDAQLGGNDFDNLLLEHLAAEFKAKNKDSDIFESKKAVLRLKIAVERAKQELTGLPDTNIDIDALVNGIDFVTNITRTVFEKLCGNLFRDVIEHVGKVLSEAKIEKSDILEVLLVGGSTRIPLIKKLVDDYFPGIPVKDTINSDDSVAKGAAILAAHLINNNGESIVNEIRSHRIKAHANGVQKILGEGNTTLRGTNFNVFENGKHLGYYDFKDSPEDVEIVFAIDDNGLLVMTKEGKSILYEEESNGLTEDEIERLKCRAKQFRDDDDSERKRCEARNQLEQNVYHLLKMIKTYNQTEEETIGMTATCEDTLQWLEANPSSSTEELKARQVRLQVECQRPIPRDEPMPDNRNVVMLNVLVFSGLLVTVLALTHRYGVDARGLVCRCIKSPCNWACILIRFGCGVCRSIAMFPFKCMRQGFHAFLHIFLRSL